MRRFARAWLAIGAACLSAAAAAADDPPAGARRGALSSGGSFYVTWAPAPDPVPLNELFEIRFRVLRPDDHEALVPDAVVTASAWMPEHNHGTTLQPRVQSHGDGTATGSGFLLHMPGRWELRVGVAVGALMERAVFELQLEP